MHGCDSPCRRLAPRTCPRTTSSAPSRKRPAERRRPSRPCATRAMGRAVFTKHGGNLGATGAVSHMFSHVGEISYPVGAGSADAVLEAAIDAGADDVQSDASGHLITS